jgi:hypothetical protein
MPKLSAACPDKKLTMPILNVSWHNAVCAHKASTEAARVRRARLVIMFVFSSNLR